MSVSAEKWKSFRANSSNLDLTHPNMGSANLQADWSRAAYGIHKIYINGTPLEDLAEFYNKFQKTEDVLGFIKNVILADFQGNEQAKEDATQYLAKSFHQGGLICPVSCALATQMKDKEGALLATLSDNYRRSIINILTTTTGFKTQEYAEANKLLAMSDSVSKYEEEGRIQPEKGEDCVIKAEAILAVDFSKDAKNPSLIVEANHIHILHKGLRSLLDNRTLGQMILDFLKYLFGLNQVKDISTSIATNNRINSDLDPDEMQTTCSDIDSNSDAHSQDGSIDEVSAPSPEPAMSMG